MKACSVSLARPRLLRCEPFCFTCGLRRVNSVSHNKGTRLRALALPGPRGVVPARLPLALLSPDADVESHNDEMEPLSAEGTEGETGAISCGT